MPAEPGLPAPLSVELTGPVLFSWLPAATPTTLTWKLHDSCASSVPPERLIVLPPAVAVIVPPQFPPARPFGVATASPAGRVSVKAIPVSATGLSNAGTTAEAAKTLGLVIVKVSDVIPPIGIEVAPKAAVMVGGAIPTLRLAVAVLPMTSWVAVTVTESM